MRRQDTHRCPSEYLSLTKVVDTQWTKLHALAQNKVGPANEMSAWCFPYAFPFDRKKQALAGHRMFLSFTSLTDASKHHAYNEWHQMDHLPENLVLPGVFGGDRWVRTPDCAAAAGTAKGDHALHEYAIVYWFRAPIQQSLAEWTTLNQTALWWGRRPELGWTRRNPVGFFDPVKGYAASRVLVDPETLPHRPHRGVRLTLSRVASPGTEEAVDLLAEYDRVHIPKMLTLPGVSGVLTYRFAESAAAFGRAEDSGADPGLFVRLAFLDDDPVETSARIAEDVPTWLGAADDREEVLFDSPLRTINPWQWDWFASPKGS